MGGGFYQLCALWCLSSRLPFAACLSVCVWFSALRCSWLAASFPPTHSVTHISVFFSRAASGEVCFGVLSAASLSSWRILLGSVCMFDAGIGRVIRHCTTVTAQDVSVTVDKLFWLWLLLLLLFSSALTTFSRDPHVWVFVCYLFFKFEIQVSIV